MVSEIEFSRAGGAWFDAVRTMAWVSIVSASLYPLLRGSELIPGTWMPTSPLAMMSRRWAVALSLAAPLTAVFLCLVLPVVGKLKAVSVSGEPEAVSWKIFTTFGRKGEIHPEPIRVAYSWIARRASATWRYRITFADGASFSTPDLDRESAKDLQVFLLAQAPARIGISLGSFEEARVLDFHQNATMMVAWRRSPSKHFLPPSTGP